MRIFFDEIIWIRLFNLSAFFSFDTRDVFLQQVAGCRRAAFPIVIASRVSAMAVSAPHGPGRVMAHPYVPGLCCPDPICRVLLAVWPRVCVSLVDGDL